MTSSDYRRALEAAVREYESLSTDRAELDARLAQLAQTIGALSRLCHEPTPIDVGLTEACRMVLRTSPGPLTAAEVRDRLEAVGFDLSTHVNALASVHTVLKRLDRSGQLQSGSTASKKSTYRWRGPVRVVAVKAGEALAFADAWLGAHVPDDSEELS